jgi:hypothetical protein
MKNNARRFTHAEYELLISALRALDQHYELSLKALTEHSDKAGSLLGALFNNPYVKKHFEEEQLRAKALRERLQNLYHHDIDWLGDGAPKWCLECHNRHEPHCPRCPGCLPEELPE